MNSQSLSAFWRKINKSDGPKTRKGLNNPPKKRDIRGFLSKLAQGFMLPVSILPIAGLLLGIGGAIGANTTDQGAIDFANFLKGASDVVFANLPILFGVAVAMAFTNRNAVYAGFMTIVAYVVFNGIQSAFIHYTDVNGVRTFHDVFYFHTDPDIQYAVGGNLGITSLQTSLFGSILIGSGVAWLMNRYSEIQLPLALSFFSGIRLVPMMLIPCAALLAIIFLVIWPFVAQVIALIGNATTDAPGGLDGLVYGVLGRSLQPFGLHHIIIGLAFQTSFGGQLTIGQLEAAGQQLGITNNPDFQTLLDAFRGTGTAVRETIAGDQNLWNFVNSLPLNRLPVNNAGGSVPVFQWFDDYVGVYAGRYTQDYPVYIGACMGIGAALILMAERANRRKAGAVVGAAMAVAFITGITEPLEYTFLFVAPLFYYAIYVPLSGIAYMLMKVSGAHVGVGFARGFIDLMIYGAVPLQKGTMFYWAFPIAAGSAIISFSTFAFGIKYFKWETPGRGANKIELVSKSQYKASVAADKETTETDAYVMAYGGIDNILSVTACATRLRISVSDPSKIDKDALKKLGSMGWVEHGSSSQNILGGKAVIVAGRISKLKGN